MPNVAHLEDDMLDTDIEQELRRGRMFGGNLPKMSRRLLTLVVDRGTVARQDAVATERCPRRWSERRIDQLTSLRFVKCEGEILSPTVRGIAAAHPFASVFGERRPPQEYLRELRREELAPH